MHSLALEEAAGKGHTQVPGTCHSTQVKHSSVCTPSRLRSEEVSRAGTGEAGPEQKWLLQNTRKIPTLKLPGPGEWGLGLTIL